jgi:hypothetical protein
MLDRLCRYVSRTPLMENLAEAGGEHREARDDCAHPGASGSGIGQAVSRSTIEARVMTSDEGFIERCSAGLADRSMADGGLRGMSARCHPLHGAG